MIWTLAEESLNWPEALVMISPMIALALLIWATTRGD